MRFEYRSCELEMDYVAYIKFLLQHHAELNLPYAFAPKLSFISSPLIFGEAMLIYSDEPHQIVGAAGFVYGTGANNHEDRHICQVELAFLQEDYRSTFLFVRGLQALLRLMKAGEAGVKCVQFWVSESEGELQTFFSRFLSLPGSEKQIINNLSLYKIPFHELEAYCRYSRVG